MGLENNNVLTLFSSWKPWNLCSEIGRFTADSEALASVSSPLEEPEPSRLVADILTQVDTSGEMADKWIVEGDEDNALPGVGVNNQLPQVFRNGNFLVDHEHILIVDLETML